MVEFAIKNKLLLKAGKNIEKIYTHNLEKIDDFKEDMKAIMNDWVEEVINELQSSYEESIQSLIDVQ